MCVAWKRVFLNFILIKLYKKTKEYVRNYQKKKKLN